MIRNSKTLIRGALALGLAVALGWEPAALAQEKISVPLTEPSKPAWVEVSLAAGSIRVEAYDGAEILVTAATEMEETESDEPPRRDGLRRIPNTSKGMTVEEADNEVAIWVKSWNRAVNLELKVPRRTSLKIAQFSDGDVEVRGVTGELEIGNTNGSITALDVSGPVVAQTVNGEIRVTFDTVTPGKAMSFININGGIDVTFPADLAADLRMRSDRGDIETGFDFEADATTRRSQEGGEGRGFRLEIETEIRGKVGGGGPEMVFKAFNGDILIRKGK